MILINLLPPELRRRHSGANPVMLGLVGSAVVCLLLGAFYLWLQHRITIAHDVQNAKADDLVAVTKLADAVRNMETTIDEHKRRKAMIYNLLAHKLYWAKTLDDFENLLNGPWPAPGGFDVRCTDLNITEAGNSPTDRAPGEEQVKFNVFWHYKILGKDYDYSGAYFKSFIDTVKGSKFWNENGFVGAPDASYLGDQPVRNPTIQRTINTGSLTWTRLKKIKDAAAEGR